MASSLVNICWTAFNITLYSENPALLYHWSIYVWVLSGVLGNRGTKAFISGEQGKKGLKMGGGGQGHEDNFGEHGTLEMTILILGKQLSRSMTKPTKWHVCTAKTQISLGIRPVWSVFAVRSMSSQGSKVSSCGQRRLIRLGGCPGWAKSSLGAQVILLVLSCDSSIYFRGSREQVSPSLCGPHACIND